MRIAWRCRHVSRRHYAHGLCGSCYRMQWRKKTAYRPPLYASKKEQCPKCGEKRMKPGKKLCRACWIGSSVDRFWAQVKKTEHCWFWRGTFNSVTGYGVFSHRAVHRFSWTLAHGIIPSGLHVCHHCDTPLCVRPDHLFLGTPKENQLDSVRKGRRAYGDRNGSRLHPEKLTQVGEAHWKAKLSDDQIAAIRFLRTGGWGIVRLAQTFDVSHPYISRLCLRKSRKLA